MRRELCSWAGSLCLHSHLLERQAPAAQNWAGMADPFSDSLRRARLSQEQEVSTHHLSQDRAVTIPEKEGSSLCRPKTWRKVERGNTVLDHQAHALPFPAHPHMLRHSHSSLPSVPIVELQRPQ